MATTLQPRDWLDGHQTREWGGCYDWLQGRYGLGTDNLLEASVVLANGSVVIASSISHSDLFWAFRGAGYSFGIVTSYKYKIYDAPKDKIWTLETCIFTHEQVEDTRTLANELTGEGGNQLAEFIHFVYYIRVPDVDPENAVILRYVVYEDTPELTAKYTSAYRALGPKSFTSKTVT
ncbi:hypothetical protein H2203_003464 [Taxawa tesnikishii (nom. ined.)]|nr:hypothetical protein H2203_003464 [Dothideales sp. JES 119]